MESKAPIIIGISGGSGSGKTELTNSVLQSHLAHDCSLVLQDNYYKHRDDLDLKARQASNYDHPDALDFDQLYIDLQSLKKWQIVTSPIYDFATHLRKSEFTNIKPNRFIILEGTLIFSQQKIFDLIDLSIFVDAPESVRFHRRMARDIEERGRTRECVTAQFQDSVSPMHDQFIEPTKLKADSVISGEADLKNSTQKAIELIKSLENNN